MRSVEIEGYIARDGDDNSLTCFLGYPTRGNGWWECTTSDDENSYRFLALDPETPGFEDLTFESEPVKVRIKIYEQED